MSALTELQKELDAVKSWIDEAQADVDRKASIVKKAMGDRDDAQQVLWDRQDQAARYETAIAALDDDVKAVNTINRDGL